MKVGKAAFPVAGFWARFLPAAEAMPKKVLPIMDKLIIQYSGEGGFEAEIAGLIIVPVRARRATQDHFAANPESERALRDMGAATHPDWQPPNAISHPLYK